MPRVRRRTPRVRGELPNEETLYLLSEGPERWERLDLDVLRDAWEAHAEAFLHLYVFGGFAEVVRVSIRLPISDRGPGRRPYAWWLFDAPEPSRRRLHPGPLPDPSYGEAFGVPMGFLESVYVNVRDPDGFETELAYLQRHGLLSAEEVDLLNAPAGKQT